MASLNDEGFKEFLMEAETFFLEHRLKCLGEKDLEKLLSVALSEAPKWIKLSPALQQFIPQFIKVLESVWDCGMMECKERNACQHSIKVPWTLALGLVGTRSVVLSGGVAVVECGQMVQLLCCLFTTLYKLRLDFLERGGLYETAQRDERYMLLFTIVRSSYRRLSAPDIINAQRRLQHTDVERQARHFPLCMRELHGMLTRQNRLRHNERFRFTLYLKDIGLPLQESIAFWESYYSKPHCSTKGGCQHDWESNKRRYVYSIRHAYGYEGSMRNQPSHSCTSLQREVSSPQEAGGCPFNSYNPDEIKPLLQPLLGANTHVWELITQEMKAKRPTAACKTLMAFTLKQGECGAQGSSKDKQDNNVCDIEDIATLLPQCVYNKPSQYYFKMSSSKE